NRLNSKQCNLSLDHKSLAILCHQAVIFGEMNREHTMRHQLETACRLTILALFLCAGLSIARAQEITGELNGTVKDTTGAAVTGATVTLEVGNIAVTVTVTSEILQVNTQSAVASSVINGDQVRELSLNNRNWAQLITLSPGVSANVADQIYVGSTNPAGQSNALQISVNGVRSSSNTYTVDGADTTDRGANLTVQTYPSVDAIQEFSVLRSLYPAESGRSAGGQVNVVTKSGTADYHGDIYEFFRNDKLNANSFTNNRTAPLGLDKNGKAKRAPLRYNNFGGTFGGPVILPWFGEGGHAFRKLNETFFFFSEELRRVIV